jgi:hypothetical protein
MKNRKCINRKGIYTDLSNIKDDKNHLKPWKIKGNTSWIYARNAVIPDG